MSECVETGTFRRLLNPDTRKLLLPRPQHLRFERAISQTSTALNSFGGMSRPSIATGSRGSTTSRVSELRVCRFDGLVVSRTDVSFADHRYRVNLANRRPSSSAGCSNPGSESVSPRIQTRRAAGFRDSADRRNGSRGDVREEHKRWRCDVRLRSVEDPNVPLARAGRGVLSRHSLDELVQLRRLDPLLPRLGHLVDRLEQPRVYARRSPLKCAGWWRNAET